MAGPGGLPLAEPVTSQEELFPPRAEVVRQVARPPVREAVRRVRRGQRSALSDRCVRVLPSRLPAPLYPGFPCVIRPQMRREPERPLTACGATRPRAGGAAPCARGLVRAFGGARRCSDGKRSRGQRTGRSLAGPGGLGLEGCEVPEPQRLLRGRAGGAGAEGGGVGPGLGLSHRVPPGAGRRWPAPGRAQGDSIRGRGVQPPGPPFPWAWSEESAS